MVLIISLPCPDIWLPVWSESSRQPTGEGDTLCGDGPTVGHPPDCAPAQHAPSARVPQGQGQADVVA